MDNQTRAYFESEAARPMLRPDDYKAQVAIANIGTDDGAKWRKYLETADLAVRDAVAATYSRMAGVASDAMTAKMNAAKETYTRELVARTGKNAAKAALRKAREIWPGFVAPR